jgi:hypothetical protein
MTQQASEQRAASPTSPPRRRRQTKAVDRRNRGSGTRARTPGARAHTSPTSFRAKARYRFDNAISRGPWVVIGTSGW